MSWPLSFTSMISPEMMLSVATSTISARIRNITFRSTCSALKNVTLRICEHGVHVRDAVAALMHVGDRHVKGAVAFALHAIAVDARTVVLAPSRSRRWSRDALVQRHVGLYHAGATLALDHNQVARRTRPACWDRQKQQLDGLLENSPRGHMDERPVVHERRVERREGSVGESRVFAEVLTDEVGASTSAWS